MAKYVLALDQGTTSSRAIVFDHAGSIVSVAQQEFPQIYPSPGLVEHDPEAIWSSQLAVAHEAMKKAGVYIGGNRLQPTSTATTVRAQNGKSNVLDGPYAETKEQLGGYYMIEAPDLDAALAWAARCPGATYGAIEVRPIWVM